MNMRIYKHIPLIAAAALLLLAGCAKDPALLDAGSITVEASIGAMTKVSAASGFEAGDQIAVYAWTGSADAVPATLVVDGVVNTFDGGAWTPASAMYWKTASDAHYFLAVSPVHTVSDFTADPYTLDLADYTASDLLFAANLGGVKSGDGAVKLAFRHAMAKLVVNLSFRSQFDGTPDVSAVTLSAKTKASVNYLTQAVSATGDAASVSLPAATANGSYSAILVPQDGVRKVTVTIAGKDYVYTAGEDIPLASGQVTTLNLTVGRDKIELSGVSVSDWTAGSALPGGVALAHHDAVDMGNGVLWATCNIGATQPWEVGEYFAWGETEPKTTYTWANYKWMREGMHTYEFITKYTYADKVYKYNSGVIWYDGNNFVGDNKKTFADDGYTDDAAHQNWGGTWRIPTYEEFEWLKDKEHCDWVWTTNYKGTGVRGMIVTSKIPGYESNSIFLPVGGYRNGSETEQSILGYYWSSSLADASYLGGCLDFGVREGESTPVLFVGGNYRNFGSLVRPVSGVANPELGDLYYSDGTWSPTLVEGKTPIGVIAYLGEDAFTETGTDVGGTPFKGHGLVLCLKNAATGEKWSTENVSIFPGLEVTDASGLKRTTNVSGYMNTATLTADAETAAKYPAATAAKYYTGLPAPAGTTGWFLPSAQQWVRMMMGLGGLSEDDIKWLWWFDNDHAAVNKWETAMAKAGADGTAYDSMTDIPLLLYWSSSECSADDAVLLNIDVTDTGDIGFAWEGVAKVDRGSDVCTRPVLAF